MADDISRFIDAASKSLRDDTFAKLVLSNYKGADETLQKVIVRRIITRKGQRLEFNYRYKTRDVAKNYSHSDALALLATLVGHDFRSAHLFATDNDIQLEAGKTGEIRLSRSKPSFAAKPSLEHDRSKEAQVDRHARYLRELGITSDIGEILGKQRDKWTQINKFVEIIAGLIDNSSLKDKKSVSVVDMGSGKGYLTFALYDHLTNTRGLNTKVTGVEVRKDLVKLCNAVAKRCDFEGLQFVQDTIDGFELKQTDILIALHACDTATDDALFKGISANAKIIIAAPCCHKEVRRQIKSPDILKNVLKHGSLMETTAETITDGLRAMLLEREGYATKVFEFVGAEHTPKNNMIVATHRGGRSRGLEAFEGVETVKRLFGIDHQRLEVLLGSRSDVLLSRT